MRQLFFRVRGIRTMMDIDPPLIEEVLSGIVGADRVRVYDDRASDATSATAVLTLEEPTPPQLAEIRRALLSLARVRVMVVDRASRDAEVPLEEIEAARLIGYAVPEDEGI